MDLIIIITKNAKTSDVSWEKGNFNNNLECYYKSIVSFSFIKHFILFNTHLILKHKVITPDRRIYFHLPTWICAFLVTTVVTALLFSKTTSFTTTFVTSKFLHWTWYSSKVHIWAFILVIRWSLIAIKIIKYRCTSFKMTYSKYKMSLWRKVI